MAQASRAKRAIPEMMPQKEWLSKSEAMAYMDMNITDFDELVKSGELSVSTPTGKTKGYFSVKEINRLFQRKINFKAIA